MPVRRSRAHAPAPRSETIAASYACTATLPNFHHEVRRVFGVGQLRRADSCRWRHPSGSRLLFDAQVDPSALRQHDRGEGPECALREDGIDVADHVPIITIISGDGGGG